MQCQFFHDIMDVALDGFHRKAEPVRNLLVGLPFGNEGHNLPFSFGEHFPGRLFPGGPFPFQIPLNEVPGDFRTQVGFPLQDGPGGRDQFQVIGFFQDVSVGSRLQGGEDVLVIASGLLLVF